MKIAVIGLGRMGGPIATHIRRRFSAATLAVHDKQMDLAHTFADGNNAQVAETADAACRGSEFIVTSLPADNELLAIAEQVASSVPSGAVWIDHSTTSATAAREVNRTLQQRSASFLDAPVSGGVEGAKQGSLTVMVGGAADAFDRAQPVMDAYAARVTHLGESGAGQMTKMTNQICVLGVCQALAEGLDFAERAGLDASQVVDVMLQGSSSSWQMKNRAAQMLAADYDFGFSTQLMRKDVGLLLAQARAMQVELPVASLVSGLLDEVDAMGGANWDWCSLMERQRSS